MHIVSPGAQTVTHPPAEASLEASLVVASEPEGPFSDGEIGAPASPAAKLSALGCSIPRMDMHPPAARTSRESIAVADCFVLSIARPKGTRCAHAASPHAAASRSRADAGAARAPMGMDQIPLVGLRQVRDNCSADAEIHAESNSHRRMRPPDGRVHSALDERVAIEFLLRQFAVPESRVEGLMNSESSMPNDQPMHPFCGTMRRDPPWDDAPMILRGTMRR
jgi:hypothetical protein